MLQHLDATLEALLQHELPSDLTGQIYFSFDTPNKEAIANTPAINLFLYDVRENLELRTGLGVVERHDRTAIKRRPPARVDCSYLITAWGTKESDPIQEHSLLGEVLKALLRYPRLPAEILRGSLKGQEPPIRTAVMRQSQLQSLGEFWQAIGGKPKAALNYTVTISVPVHDAGEVFPLAVDVQI